MKPLTTQPEDDTLPLTLRRTRKPQLYWTVSKQKKYFPKSDSKFTKLAISTTFKVANVQWIIYL